MSKLASYSCLVFIAVTGTLLLSSDKTLAQNQGGPHVTVTNTPLPVTVTNQPAAVVPFVANCRIYLSGNAGQSSAQTVDQSCDAQIHALIPGGGGTGTGAKQMVVQAVSATVTGLDAGVMPLSLNLAPIADGVVFTEFAHSIPLSFQGKDGGGSGYFAGMQSLTWILDPHFGGLVCDVTLISRSVTSGFMACTVSGYLQ
jgi:hypothetical protein